MKSSKTGWWLSSYCSFFFLIHHIEQDEIIYPKKNALFSFLLPSPDKKQVILVTDMFYCIIL